MAEETQVTHAGKFTPSLDLKAMANAGLIPQSNFQVHERYTKALQSRVVELVLQNYILDRLLSPAPVSFFQAAFEWQKEKAMKGAQLDMAMMGRSTDQADYETDSVILPGWTKNWAYSWRQRGIAETNGVPLVSNTERQAIKRLLIDANKLGFEGASGSKIKGLLDAAEGDRVVAAGTVWSDLANGDPFDDVAQALQEVAEQDYEVPQGYHLVLHPTNAAEARRNLNANTDMTQMRLIERDLGSRVKVVETTAVPEGTALGIPRGAEFAELLTTGLPSIVPIKADQLSVEYQARMIAVPVFYDRTPFFKITGI